MARIIINFTPRLGCSGVVTFQAARPGQAVFWDLAAYDPADPETEYPSQGSWKFAATLADQSSLAVNVYRAPDPAEWNGRYDRLRVRCDA